MIKIDNNVLDMEELESKLEEASDYWLDIDLKDNYEQVRDNQELRLEEDCNGVSSITLYHIIDLLINKIDELEGE